MRREFKGRRFEGGVILWAVRWYCRYGISYRKLAEKLAERGVRVDHTTVYRCVQRHAPEIEARRRWIWRASSLRRNWQVDEEGRTLDFHPPPTRSAKAAKRFLGKAIRACTAWETPVTLTTDKAPTYPLAVAELKREGRCPPGQVPQQPDRDRSRAPQAADQADLGLQVDADGLRHHQGLRGDARAKKGQGGSHQVQEGIRGEVRLVERAFGIGPDSLSEAVARLQALNLAA